MSELAQSPLGKKNTYTDKYDSSILFAICRDGNRVNINIDIRKLPFTGVDIWNGFDFTWLDINGEPKYGVLTIIIPADSVNLIESKSLKLYLFSFANSIFSNNIEIIKVIEKDLSAASVGRVTVTLEENIENNKSFAKISSNFEGCNLDELDVQCIDTQVNSDLLLFEQDNIVTEQVCSDLLKSNCLVTGKPDWGSVRISYTGPKVNHEGLLRYIISYRNHQGFHEQCIEKIYYDLLTIGKLEKLTVEGRYTRRGGLDINPVRSSLSFFTVEYSNDRLIRQ
ncbi:MAG: NADPH-dependent 7-cyano-7-deazaguanine reductase QueF [Gammaproteobacteria bacterium]|nr:NADPH-dependent 7-cyano-7-deazaguanine reductase QueF [Gammaproteobacteria bacterium]